MSTFTKSLVTKTPLVFAVTVGLGASLCTSMTYSFADDSPATGNRIDNAPTLQTQTIEQTHTATNKPLPRHHMKKKKHHKHAQKAEDLDKAKGVANDKDFCGPAGCGAEAKENMKK